MFGKVPDGADAAGLWTTFAIYHCEQETEPSLVGRSPGWQSDSKDGQDE